MPDSNYTSPQNHYEVLGLTENSRDVIAQDAIKAAYRKALLQHHPDKRSAAAAAQHRETNQPRDIPSSTSKLGTLPVNFSIDQISLAYKVLADPTARAEYDRHLQLLAVGGTDRPIKDFAVNTGVETLDLEELDYNECTFTWRRACRCGNTTGFSISDEQLEWEANHGEIYVGCEGCSLWIRVLFEVEESPSG